MRSNAVVGRLAGSPTYGTLGTIGGSSENQHNHVLDNGANLTSRNVDTTNVPAWNSSGAGALATNSVSGGSSTHPRITKTMNDVTIPTVSPHIVMNYIICATV